MDPHPAANWPSFWNRWIQIQRSFEDQKIARPSLQAGSTENAGSASNGHKELLGVVGSKSSSRLKIGRSFGLPREQARPRTLDLNPMVTQKQESQRRPPKSVRNGDRWILNPTIRPKQHVLKKERPRAIESPDPTATKGLAFSKKVGRAFPSKTVGSKSSDYSKLKRTNLTPESRCNMDRWILDPMVHTKLNLLRRDKQRS